MNSKEIYKIPNKLFSDKQISIDWPYLMAGRGVRKIENVLQIVVGRILFWLVIMLEVGIIVSELTKGFGIRRLITGEGTPALFFWIFALLLLYTFFLLRDRSIFLDKIRTNDLYQLKRAMESGRRIDRIELSDYLNHSLILIVDQILNLVSNDYAVMLLRKLLKLPRARNVIERLGITADQLPLDTLSSASMKLSETIFVKDLLTESFVFAYENGLKMVDEETLIYKILEKYIAGDLSRFNILPRDLDGIKLWIRSEAQMAKYVSDWKGRVSLKPKSTVNRAYTSRFTPTLNRFAKDFTNDVIQGDFTLSIARENELNQLITVLEKGEKSAVLIVGEPGVGKTTLIKTLAVRMVVEDVPVKLQDCRLVGFDFNKAFTSSKDPDHFKSTLRTIFDEVAKSGNVILVLDNINQLLNLRQEVSGEIVNIIVDAFDSKKLRLIATTDKSQLVRFIRPYKALIGIFTQVEMPLPSDEVAIQIAIDEVPKIESEYNVKISYSGVKGAVELSHKFAYDRVLPDKALDLLKETVVNFKQLAGKKPIEYEEVAKVVSSKVGVNLGAIGKKESERLAHLEEIMHKRVIDQDEAIDAVCGALRRSRSGLSEGGRPVASFLFFGPTGVGKTEVAKTVSEVYFGSETRMVRIDMSEYNEEANLARLIGFTSERGSFEGGLLTEAIYTNPFNTILLDEVDKANPKVLDLFLQVLDEGYLVDGLGRKIDFSNAIIIATSNAGSGAIAALLEKGEPYSVVHEKALEELKKVFRIEFLNRFDKVIMFKSLSREEVKLVAKKFVEKVRLKLLDKGIKLVYNDRLLTRLAQIGYSPVFGAREMRRIVQEEVENKVAEKIIKGEVRMGEEVEIV